MLMSPYEQGSPQMQIALHSPTGRRLVCVSGVSCWNAWEALQASIASHYEVPVDAVEMSEQDDGTEAVFVCGYRRGHIVTVIDGHTFGAIEPDAVVAPLPQAAE
jgi:hypothetical protein